MKFGLVLALVGPATSFVIEDRAVYGFLPALTSSSSRLSSSMIKSSSTLKSIATSPKLSTAVSATPTKVSIVSSTGLSSTAASSVKKLSSASSARGTASSVRPSSTAFTTGTVPSTVTVYPTYSSFPIGSIPCNSPPAYSSFDTSRAGPALNTACISSQGVTLQSGGVTKYSGVGNGVTAAVELVASPSCKPGPVSFDAERCLNAFANIENKCPAYGGGYVFDISLGCLLLTLSAPNNASNAARLV